MILHISADYPDPIAPAKTKAVHNLLAATNDIPHAIYSINRVNWPGARQRYVRLPATATAPPCLTARRLMASASRIISSR